MKLEVKDLSFSYGERKVLKDICFTAESGALLSVLGPNGVGKSTLFRCILGRLVPQNGTVLVDGQAVTAMPPVRLAQHIAYIPQSAHPAFNYSVFDMVLMGMTAQIAGFRSPKEEDGRKVCQVLERLKISHLKDRGYQDISGGERQLVLIARAMVQEAGILLMDEPTANLDYGNRIRVMQTIRELVADGYTVIQSTHDPEQAFLYSDKLLALLDGQVLAVGRPQEIVCEELISQLYGVEVEVCSLRQDAVRICVPKNIQ